jgi:hypothetical protein
VPRQNSHKASREVIVPSDLFLQVQGKMSAFTALNGGSPSRSEPPSAISDTNFNPDDRPRSSAAHSQAGTENSTQRENWTTQGAEGSATRNSPKADQDSSLKRKRSTSLELRREHPTQERTPDTATAPPHGEARDPFDTPQRDREQWYAHQAREDRSHYDVPQSARTSPGHMEDHIGDALRRAAQGDRSEYDHTSPDGDERSTGAYGSPHTTHRQGSMLQHDPKKRKRNFSNRTKTGCMTCRGRKKKCDETKPECLFTLSSAMLAA